jgi:hypothetical protein
MGNDNRALGVERWREYRVTRSCESVMDERRGEVDTMILGSTGLVLILEDPSEG